ncbi:hypothetical protein ACSUZJ_08335 [Telluria sp. B2]
MRQDDTGRPASGWLGATIFSLLTGTAFGFGSFMLVLAGPWYGSFFYLVAITLSCLCWIALPYERNIQLWVTGLAIALQIGYAMYWFSNFKLRFM